MVAPNEELVRRMRADLDEAADIAARTGRQVCLDLEPPFWMQDMIACT